MADIAVIGAGHAGVEAAFTLAKSGVHVTLYTNEDGLPYFRPRLIAVAFGQVAPEAILMKPAVQYDQAGVTLCHQPVTQLEVAARTVNERTFDGVILAQGSQPFVPPFSGEGVSRVVTLWTMKDALRLRALVHTGVSLVIIGGGVLGLEAALRAALVGMRVTVIEAAPALLGGCLGKSGEYALRQMLTAKGIILEVGTSISEITPTSVCLVNGKRISAEVVLCSTGARPNTELSAIAGLPIAQGVQTQSDLSVAPYVYAAGDLARPAPGRPVCSVMRAMRMGTLAARNLLAALQNQAGQAWEEVTLPLFMKVEDVEFYTAGDCFSPDAQEERIDDGEKVGVWKSVLKRGDRVIGLRWVGTRIGFADWEKQLVR